jgi:peptidoglycan/LPS O-acetylase OafA/YrhL
MSVIKPVIAAMFVCALATACSMRSHTTVEKPVAPSGAAVVAVPASPAPATATVVTTN